MKRKLRCHRCGNEDQKLFEVVGWVAKCKCGLVDCVGVLDTNHPHLRVGQEKE